MRHLSMVFQEGSANFLSWRRNQEGDHRKTTGTCTDLCKDSSEFQSDMGSKRLGPWLNGATRLRPMKLFFLFPNGCMCQNRGNQR